MPLHNEIIKPTDQPWFGPQCRTQAKIKKLLGENFKGLLHTKIN